MLHPVFLRFKRSVAYKIGLGHASPIWDNARPRKMGYPPYPGVSARFRSLELCWHCLSVFEHEAALNLLSFPDLITSVCDDLLPIFPMASMPAPDRSHPGDWAALTDEVLGRCAIVAGFSEENGKITRTFLCEPMRRLHDLMTAWMQAARMSVRRDAIGNLIGHYPGSADNAPVFLIGSHLDSVPNAGKYDGVLGVLLGIAAVQALGGR